MRYGKQKAEVDNMRRYRTSRATSRQFSRAAGIALIGAMLSAASPDAQAATPCIDVALVIAVDGSGSVDESEYALQQHGIAAALRDREVQLAIAAAGTVSISILFWGSAGQPVQETEWVTITGPEQAERLARMVEAQPRKIGGFTGLGAALRAAIGKLSALETCAYRAVINVSGDGKDTLVALNRPTAIPPEKVRDEAAIRGITINGLVISNEEPDVADYYTGSVITGSDAFVMTISDYRDYAEALQRKLIREIGPVILGQRTYPSTVPDCPAGCSRW